MTNLTLSDNATLTIPPNVTVTVVGSVNVNRGGSINLPGSDLIVEGNVTVVGEGTLGIDNSGTLHVNGDVNVNPDAEVSVTNGASTLVELTCVSLLRALKLRNPITQRWLLMEALAVLVLGESTPVLMSKSVEICNLQALLLLPFLPLLMIMPSLTLTAVLLSEVNCNCMAVQ